jgi:hypothetical protein
VRCYHPRHPGRDGPPKDKTTPRKQTDRHVDTQPQQRRADSGRSLLFGQYSNFPLPALFLKKHTVAWDQSQHLIPFREATLWLLEGRQMLFCFVLFCFFTFTFWGEGGGEGRGQGQDWGRIFKIHTGVHMSDWVSWPVVSHRNSGPFMLAVSQNCFLTF